MRGGETIPELFGHRFKQTRKLYKKGNIKGHKLQGKNVEAKMPQTGRQKCGSSNSNNPSPNKR
jgi:hypothetical protein